MTAPPRSAAASQALDEAVRKRMIRVETGLRRLGPRPLAVRRHAPSNGGVATLTFTIRGKHGNSVCFTQAHNIMHPNSPTPRI